MTLPAGPYDCKHCDVLAQVGGPWTRAEVAKHNQMDDCWLIVTDKRDGVTKVRNMIASIPRCVGQLITVATCKAARNRTSAVRSDYSTLQRLRICGYRRVWPARPIGSGC